MAGPEVKVVVSAVVDGFDRSMRSVDNTLASARRKTDAAAASFTAFGDKMDRLGKRMSVVTAGLAAVGGAAFLLTKNVAASGDEIAKAARGAGVSGEYFQEMAYSLGQVAAVSEGEMAAGMQRVNKMLGDAANGSKSAIEAFDRIGISQADISSGAVSAEIAYSKLIDSLANATDAGVAASVASEFLGRSNADLGPKLMGSAGALSELRNRAHDLGIVMSQDALSASEKFGDQMDDVGKGVDGLKIKLANELLPIFTNTLLPAINDKVIPAFGALIEQIGGVINWFAQLPGPVQEAAAIVGAALGLGGPILVGVGLVSKAIGGLIAAGGPIGLFIAAAGLLYTAWQVWGDDIKALIGGVVEYIGSAFDGAVTAISGFGSQAMESVRGAVQYMQDQFNAFLAFVRAIPAQLMEIGSQMIQGLLDGINAKWEELKARIYALGEMLPQWLRDMLDIRSPSRVFMEIGEYVGQGMAQGIANSTAMVAAAAANMGRVAVDQADASVGQVLNSMGQLFQGSKKISAGIALANSWLAFTEVLKDPSFIGRPFARFAAAASALSAGLNAVRNIKSASTSGGGGSSGGATSGAGASAPTPPTQNFVIDAPGMDIGSLVDSLNRATDAGYRIRVNAA
jgi:hypothetical protein